MGVVDLHGKDPPNLSEIFDSYRSNLGESRLLKSIFSAIWILQVGFCMNTMPQ